MTYTAQFTRTRDVPGFQVTFPDLPEIITHGFDEQDAYSMAIDALTTALQWYIDEKADLPEPRAKAGRNRRPVSLPALVSAKLELYRAMRASAIRKSELARKTGIAKQHIDRLFHLQHATRLDVLEKALAACGKRLEVAAVDAA